MINFFLGLSIIWLVWYLGSWIVSFICFIKEIRE